MNGQQLRCDKCRHWMGSRDSIFNEKHNAASVCHVHQPAEFRWDDVCNYFDEAKLHD